MTASTCTFRNDRGHDLAARLDTPDGPTIATAIFAHCFTGSKDLRVERQLIEGLTAQGFAVLSFDFAGLGGSEGEFVDTTFTGNVGDLRAAAAHLTELVAAPALLVGHSLGGAAVLSVAPDLPSVRAVATIGAPADPAHVTHLLEGNLHEIARDGSAQVSIGGRLIRVGRDFVEDLERHEPTARSAAFRGATLVMHSPLDEVVGIDNAERIYDATRHPKSFVSLDDADHLLTDAADAAYASTVIAAWSGRYVRAKP